MSGRIAAALAALLVAGCVPLPAPVAEPATTSADWAAACTDWDEWDKPGPPFRIHGNSYYVGTCGIGAILITSDDGHYLIDSGTEAGADVVLANIRALGFDPADVVLLLTSHEHFDHVGGMAKLQRATGAEVVTSPAAEPVLRTGIASADDPQVGIHEPMEPVAQVGTNGLGNHFGYILDRVGLNFIATPGHTPGALSWYWRSCDEAGDCRNIVYADSLSPVSSEEYRFSDHPAYVAAYREGVARLAQLDCDMLLTPHPSASGMRANIIENGQFSSRQQPCVDYSAQITARLDARLAEEQTR